MSEIVCATCGESLDITVEEASGEPYCPVCSGPVWLDGRWRLTALLGRGAVARIYKAERIEDGAVFAIKELAVGRLDSLKTQELFEREARVLRQLDHPAVPRCHEEFIWGIGKHQAFYLVEDFIAGETLSAEFASRRYTEDEVLGFLEQMCDVLTYLHERTPPVIHRDITPKNIMRRAEDGRLMLIDFGVVRDGVVESVGGETAAGTFGYMAPEQLQGKAWRASDLYGLGAVALHMLTRKPPHTMLTRTGQLDWRPALEGEVCAQTLDLLTEMLQPDHTERAADARAMRRRITQARASLAGEQTSGGEAPRRALVMRASEERAPEDGSSALTHAPRHQESLFGVYLMLGAAGVAATPCLVLFFGVINTLVVASVLLLAMVLLVPFMPQRPHSEDPPPPMIEE